MQISLSKLTFLPSTISRLFDLLKSLKKYQDDPSGTRRLLSQLAGILNAVISVQPARPWEMRTWRDTETGKGLLDTAIHAHNEYAVQLLLTTGICGIFVPQVRVTKVHFVSPNYG